ncbi:uncharacterized protein PV07_04824 [Cladophialophora immunda]|uniref:Uncharacterized protein n=1 Tax=Cladophialophora immunda TaxID=569365 RepID=A0A0D2CD20_9EURO|nr:uncharacterized protein PV07_04824 [Cladophialophora immunda]KIW28973.1 hypothetical protein PV07_04824 [Cladophialophora immunda]OQU98618.1 hypothetical protein CLAIMM_04375 [Cladophialophora immunda]
MAQNQVKETDIAVLIAAIQSSVGPIQVDAEKVAKHLGMSLSSIPPKFTAIRKRYNIDIKVVNSGALQRNRQNSPKKRLSVHGPKPMRNATARTQSGSEAVMELPDGLHFEPAVAAKEESP